MIPFKRTLCLFLLAALIVPGSVHPARAEEPAPEASLTSDSALSVGSADTSQSVSTTDTSATHLDVADTSSSVSVSSASQETDTTTHREETAASGTATDMDASPAGTAPMQGDSGTALVATDATTTPIDTLTTASAGTDGTSSSVASSTSAADSTGTTITTGDATAGANMVNVASSNFVNSTGAVVLGNYFDPSVGIDLRTATSSFSTGALCVLFACTGSQGVSLNVTGTSSLDNAFAVSATTGSNTVSTSTNARITTGSALVGLNLVNLANLNVVDSTYLIAALNIFRGLTGDIVFPNLDGFFDSGNGDAAAAAVTLDSNADVANDIAFATGTGNNTALATTSSITSGASHTSASVLNQLNSNSIGGASLAIALRVQGAWTGQVFNAPEGLLVTRGDDGSIYLTNANAHPLAFAGDATMNASSSALITNHIELNAFTGDNGIFGADSARIVTGNALAAANVVNLANQNIIGRNWLTAVVNIFGDFTGNIAFGRPDLWVGERIEAPAPLTDGSLVALHFTITNKGDAPASAVSFIPSFDSAHLSLTDTAPDTTDLGTLAPGASLEVVLHAQVHGGPGIDVVTSGTASARETDNNPSDNTDTVTLHTISNAGGGSGQGLVSYAVSFPHAEAPSLRALVVTRHTHSAQAGAGARIIHEELSVLNQSDATSSPVDLHDLLKDPIGTVVEDEAWPLGTLAPHEEVQVAYDVVFDAAAPTGMYLLSTVLASDTLGDTEFKNNGTIVLAGIRVLPSRTRGISTTALHVTRGEAEQGITLGAATSSSLLAAVENAHIPWTYAAGFVGSFALLAGFLWSILWLRRRHIAS